MKTPKMKDSKRSIVSNRDEIERIDNETVDRYNKRFEKYGVEAKTLGWGCKDDQIIRFTTAITYTDFSGKSVLDIGCGFADFYHFLINKGIKIKKYKGIDINGKLIQVAKKRFPQNEYEVRNILLENYGKIQGEIVTLFGLLNFKLNEINNLNYTRIMIDAAWKIAKETLIVDFLSTHLTKSYPKEDFVYYHNPKDVLDFCFRLCDNIVLVHDYPSIPQKEFMAILKKSRGDK